MAPKIFITGATGYIGGDALYALHAAHPEYEYSVLVRNSDKGSVVAAQYPKIRLVYGGLDDAEILEKEAAAADIVLDTADSADHVAAAQALSTGLTSPAASPPAFWIHTSGTGILCYADQASKAYGEAPARPPFNDLSGVHKLTSLPDGAPHRNVDKMILSTSSAAVKTAIVCPPMIYGPGRGPGNKRSQQIYTLARKTMEAGQPIQAGRGLTEWNTVHVHDLSDVYVRLVEAAVSGTRNDDGELWGAKGYFFVESGFKTWGEMARLVGEEAFRQGFIKNREPKVVDAKEAVKIAGGTAMTWGWNSRGLAGRAREFLGWKPVGKTLEEELPEIVSGEAEILGLKKGYAEKAAGKGE